LKFELNGIWKEAAHLRWHKPFITILKQKMLNCVLNTYSLITEISKYLACCAKHSAYQSFLHYAFITSHLSFSWVIASWFLRFLPNPGCSNFERHILGALAAFSNIKCREHSLALKAIQSKVLQYIVSTHNGKDYY